MCFGFHIRFASAFAILACACAVGCGTTTTQKGTEQLLISDAVDNAVAQIDFRVLNGQKVYIDTVYLRSVSGIGFVNSEYIISSLRQQLTAAHCLIQDSRESADVIVEPRVGALGTDGHEVVYGIPQSGSIANAAAALSSSPIPPLPEISFGKSNAQTGIAKVIVFAYDRETREAIWQSGVAKAESTSRNTWYLGAGPFQKGSIHKGTRFAGQAIPFPQTSEQSVSGGIFDQPQPVPESVLSEFIPYNQPFVFDRAGQLDSTVPPGDSSADSESGIIRAVGHQEDAKKE